MSGRTHRFADVRKGHATVLDPDTMEPVGEVEQQEERYNLRRPFVHQFWVGRDADGRTLRHPRRDHRAMFDTRDAAAAAVVAAAREQAT